MTGIDVLRECRCKGSKLLPIVSDARREMPSRNEYGEVNIGWNAGVMDGNRPYFAECWATDGITMLTVFISTKGIEDMPHAEIAQKFADTGYYIPRENAHKPTVMEFTDTAGNGFFSINIAVGNEDEVFLDGAPILAPGVLNEYLKNK